jgi:transposase
MLVTDGQGLPLAVHLASANCAETRLAEETVGRVRVPRRRGRPRQRPEKLVADRGYDSDPFRRWLRRKGITPCIPARSNRRGRRKSWEEEYRQRWRVERTFAWVGNFRRLALRYERLVSVYRAFFILACIIICLRKLLK